MVLRLLGSPRDRVKLAGNPRLLALQEVEWNGTGVVRLEELRSFVEEPRPTSREECLLGARLCVVRVKVAAEMRLERLLDLVGQLDRRVVVLDEFLDEINRDGAHRATRPFLMLPDAREIPVDTAGVAPRVRDDHPATAPAAVERALEVVVVSTLFLASLIVSGQDLLYALPKVGRNEGVVRALVLHAAVDDDALVVGVLEQRVQARHVQRRDGLAARLRHGQAAPIQLVAETLEPPVAAGVRLEREANERRALGIDPDGASLSAVLVLADVQIANWSLPGRPAGLGLLDQPLCDFGREVSRVELGDRTHDSVEKQARRRFVDVFGAGDELRAGCSDRERDLDVVSTVARQTVDLVDDDVLDRLLAQVSEHPLKLGPVGALRAFAGINELGYYRSTK